MKGGTTFRNGEKGTRMEERKERGVGGAMDDWMDQKILWSGAPPNLGPQDSLPGANPSQCSPVYLAQNTS